MLPLARLARSLSFTAIAGLLATVPRLGAQAAPRPGTLISLATGAGPAGKTDRVTLLGAADKLAFTHDATGLHVEFPATKPGETFYTLKITGLKLR